MILTVAKLKQPIFGYHRIGTGAGAIDVHPFRGKLVDPHRLLVQGRFKVGPPRVVTQLSQHDCEAVIGETSLWTSWPVMVCSVHNRLPTQGSTCTRR